MGRSARRDASISLRHALFERDDRLFVPRPSRAVHPAVPRSARWPFRFGRSHVPLDQGGVAFRLEEQYGRREGIDTGVFLSAGVSGERESVRFGREAERRGLGRCRAAALGEAGPEGVHQSAQDGFGVRLCVAESAQLDRSDFWV